MMQLNEILSKFIAVILFAVSFLIPGSPDKLDISVSVDNTGNQIIIAEWKNETGKAVTIPKYYIEKLEGETSVLVPFGEDFGGFPEIYRKYYPTEGGRITIDSIKAFGAELPSGTYILTLYYDVLYCDVKQGKATVTFEI